MEEEITLKFKAYEIENILKLLKMSGSNLYGYPFYLEHSSVPAEKLEKQFGFTERSIKRQLEQAIKEQVEN
jgi:hypothetical protein